MKKFASLFTILLIIYNVSVCYSETFESVETETIVIESTTEENVEDVEFEETSLENTCDSESESVEEKIESEDTINEEETSEESDEPEEIVEPEEDEDIDIEESVGDIATESDVIVDEEEIEVGSPSEIIEEEEEEDIVASGSNVVSLNNMPMFGAGSNVYWYLKNSNTELHLSGTVPTDSAYVPGQDNYFGLAAGYAEYVTKVVIDDEIRPIDCSYWFNSFNLLTNIENLHLLNTSDVTDMSYMFMQCTALTGLDLSNFDTQKVENMSFMFYLCTNLSSVDLSSFNTEKVTNMADMFYDCYLLTTLDISSFDTSSLTNAYYMFTNAGLQRIYASPSFNISASASDQMFDGCLNLEGENGTSYDYAHVDGTYARVDTPSTPGYFTRKQLTVSFDTDGGSSIPPVIEYCGYTISAPVTPTKSGYTLENWYKEFTFTNVWNFASDVVKNNMTLYAKWIDAGGTGGGGGDGGGGGGDGGGGGGGGTPSIDPNGNITPSGVEGIGLEGLNGINLKYCTFYKWDYDGRIARNTNITYNLNDYKFYNYDLTVVANKWVGFSYFGGKIIWYYTKYDGTVNKDLFMNIGQYIYYFDLTGKMVTGRKEIGGKEYYFIEGDGPVEGVYVHNQYL